MKMWFALIVTNAMWVGIAIADSMLPPSSGSVIGTPSGSDSVTRVPRLVGTPITVSPGREMVFAAHDPDGNATIIQTDRDGHVIVPMPFDTAIMNALLKVIRLDKDGHVICAK
jgi:hypothetical protein